MSDEIEKSIERITNTFKTLAEILVEMNEDRKEEIRDLNKRIGTIEHTILRFENRLSNIEKKIV